MASLSTAPSAGASVAGARVTARDLNKPAAFAALEEEVTDLRRMGDYEAAGIVQQRLEAMKCEADAQNQQVGSRCGQMLSHASTRLEGRRKKGVVQGEISHT